MKDSHRACCRSFHHQEEEHSFEEKPFTSRGMLPLRYSYDLCACIYDYPEIITWYQNIDKGSFALKNNFLNIRFYVYLILN